ncbi:hypothetical protein ZEAMMB73_Zm00001d013528 [Zea mays]|uniref:Uncharacterized protein n=1 Tax=Zea mays TaxID=4577 RepID=A0A1D6GKA7_MAIZE|nr:hypothetical protein ZEAMMB73_Zm00001d013528 [Zea mays]
MSTSPAASSSAPTAFAASAVTMAAEAADGPVLSVVSKRLRALRKKYNRITQMEESLAAGKSLNREQEEVLRSKPVVAALIDELERLRPPLASALAEELSSRSAPAPAATASSSDSDSSVQDLLALVYFGSLFDVKQQFTQRRSYQNQRSGGGRGGGRRGYPNGRGVRGYQNGRGGGYQNGRGGGGYQNGRGGGGGYYESGYYQPRNYNNRGRGGRNSYYNNHGGGAQAGGHGHPGRVELGANA